MDFWIVQTWPGSSPDHAVSAGGGSVAGLRPSRIVNLTHGSFYLLGAYIGLAVIERTAAFCWPWS